MKRLKDFFLGTSEELELLTRCRKIVNKFSPSAEVILYGSRARGDASEESDYDLLILVKSDLTRELKKNIAHALYALERESNTVLSVQVFEYKQWLSSKFKAMPFFHNVEREGILI